MITVRFLVEWAVRSSILIGSGALVLWVVRVKAPAVRLACWTAMLCGSLAIPALMAALPGVPLPGVPAGILRTPATQPLHLDASPALVAAVFARGEAAAEPFDWTRAAMAIYGLVAGALLLRLGAGLAMGRLLLRRSRTTGRDTDGIEIRESDRLTAPAALGIMRPAIVLPADWREWEADKLEAVLAHERSHIRRADPAVQLLSSVHRALVWHSPLSWLLDRRIVRLAEEASDDAALAAVRDRASYAEILLHFIARGVRGAGAPGVAMARYGRPEERIHRILEGAGLARGITRWSAAAIVVVACPLAYLAAAASSPRPETPVIAAVDPLGD
ncbi:MAG TPA: M56 family metallopeptidase, partial [Candidatus Sulfopaludibacter sp.]|nr:M56 family metallopeptidase [Candidatus Sulfopaludibacter sp.]